MEPNEANSLPQKNLLHSIRTILSTTRANEFIKVFCQAVLSEPRLRDHFESCLQDMEIRPRRDILPPLPVVWQDRARKFEEKGEHINIDIPLVDSTAFDRLKPNKQINDEIVNAYLNLLRNDSVYIATADLYEALKRKTRLNKIDDKINQDTLQNFIQIFIPICEGNHWTFARLTAGKLDIHDSIGGSIYQQSFVDWIEGRFPGIVVQEAAYNPRQKPKSNDCGLLMLLGIDLMSRDLDLPSQEQADVIMLSMRGRVLAGILSGRLDPSERNYEVFVNREAAHTSSTMPRAEFHGEGNPGNPIEFEDTPTATPQDVQSSPGALDLTTNEPNAVEMEFCDPVALPEVRIDPVAIGIKEDMDEDGMEEMDEMEVMETENIDEMDETEVMETENMGEIDEMEIQTDDVVVEPIIEEMEETESVVEELEETESVVEELEEMESIIDELEETESVMSIMENMNVQTEDTATQLINETVQQFAGEKWMIEFLKKAIKAYRAREFGAPKHNAVINDTPSVCESKKRIMKIQEMYHELRQQESRSTNFVKTRCNRSRFSSDFHRATEEIAGDVGAKATKAKMLRAGFSSPAEWKHCRNLAKRTDIWSKIETLFELPVSICACKQSTWKLEYLSEPQKLQLVAGLRARKEDRQDKILTTLETAQPLFEALTKGRLSEERLPLENADVVVAAMSFEVAMSVSPQRIAPVALPR
jgi:hypothetical protein